MWKRTSQICVHQAADPFFSIKMRVNELVISEVAHALHPELQDSDMMSAENEVAALLDPNVHEQITAFALVITEAIRKQKKQAD